MFEEVNKKINFTFDSHVPKTKEEIIESLRVQAARQRPFSFLIPGRLDFEEFKFMDGEIEISRKPGPLTAFRPFGKIRITFADSGSKETRVTCQIMTGNDFIPVSIAIQTFVLLVWSAGWMILGRNLDPATRYLVPVAALVVSSLISFMKYRIRRQRLIDYSMSIIDRMRDTRGPRSHSATQKQR